MITITYNGKTYKPTESWHFSVQAIVNDLIEKDCLEEVKENKEMPDIVQREKETQEGMNQVWDSIRKSQDPSILEKLREWVSTELKLDGYEHQQILDKIDLLTSLETKEEPAEFSDAVKFEIERGCMPCTWNLPPEEAKKTVKEWTDRIDGKVLPQFTPGQEIEVSNDGEKWDRGYFVELLDGRYWVKDNGFSWGKFARPIDKIEPELPAIEPISMAYQDYYEGQQSIKNKLNELVAGYQALSRQKTTK